MQPELHARHERTSQSVSAASLASRFSAASQSELVDGRLGGKAELVLDHRRDVPQRVAVFLRQVPRPGIDEAQRADALTEGAP